MHTLRFLPTGPVLAAMALLMVSSPRAQSPETPPFEQTPFEPQLQLLDFSQPTTIEGRLRLVDRSEHAIWLDWDLRLEVHPSGKKVWRKLDGDFMLLVYPRDAAQFEALKYLKPGTRLQMVIQSNETGHRVILSYGNLSPAPLVPL